LGERRLAIDSFDGPIYVAGDSTLLATALENFIQNALEAVGPNGTVRVRSWTDAANASIDIADDGPGLPPALLGSSGFLPFASTKSEGYGIGLYQSQQLIQQLGGHIEVASTAGAGTTIRVSMPRVTAQHAATSAQMA
jgi:signal transduction histidine kinase